MCCMVVLLILMNKPEFSYYLWVWMTFNSCMRYRDANVLLQPTAACKAKLSTHMHANRKAVNVEALRRMRRYTGYTMGDG